MKIKFTKGEWMIATNCIEDKYQYSVLSLGSRAICDIYRHNFPHPKNTEIDEEKSLANAKLISAAPELLEACVEAEKHHQGGHSEIGSKLREAIKKAIE